MNSSRAATRPMARVVLTLALSYGALTVPSGAAAQEFEMRPAPEPVHLDRMRGQARDQVHAALLSTSDRERNTHLDAGEQIARYLTGADSASADSWYWLAVVLGIRTDHGGPIEKLTTGREVFHTAARVLALDPDHAGGHELMGRLHAAVMSLPGIVRMMATRMGMADALGEASCQRAEDHFLRAAELDAGAIAPRVELARLYVRRDRAAEAGPVLRRAVLIATPTEVDRRLRAEARALLEQIAPE